MNGSEFKTHANVIYAHSPLAAIADSVLKVFADVAVEVGTTLPLGVRAVTSSIPRHRKMMHTCTLLAGSVTTCAFLKEFSQLSPPHGSTLGPRDQPHRGCGHRAPTGRCHSISRIGSPFYATRPHCTLHNGGVGCADPPDGLRVRGSASPGQVIASHTSYLIASSLRASRPVCTYLLTGSGMDR